MTPAEEQEQLLKDAKKQVEIEAYLMKRALVREHIHFVDGVMISRIADTISDHEQNTRTKCNKHTLTHTHTYRIKIISRRHSSTVPKC